MQSLERETRVILKEDTFICPFCGNVYQIVWLKEGDDYNDFGTRHCPFCGLIIDEYAQLLLEK